MYQITTLLYDFTLISEYRNKKSLMPFGKRDLYINLLYSAKIFVLVSI